MPEAIAAIGPLLGAGGGPGGFLKLLTTGFGLIGNIMAQQQQQSAVNRITSYQKNPAKAAAAINSLTQPLSLGLTQDVGNNVQGYLAERGLSGSPNISASVLAQALAPYQQQNQQTAEQEFFQLLNPLGAQYGKPQNMTNLFSQFNPIPGVGTPTFPGGGGYPSGSGGGPYPYPYGSGGDDTSGGGGSGSGIIDSPVDPMATYG